MARHGRAGRGLARQGRRGKAGEVGRGTARHGEAGKSTKEGAMVYEWKAGARTNGMDAQKVGERLEQIRQKHGVLTPSVIVADARLKASPLHKGFEWDDQKAAAIYREERARAIVRCVVVTLQGANTDPRQVRAFVHIGNPLEYEDIGAVMRDLDKREALLALALNRLNAVRAEYGTLEELAEVWSALDEVAA